MPPPTMEEKNPKDEALSSLTSTHASHSTLTYTPQEHNGALPALGQTQLNQLLAPLHNHTISLVHDIFGRMLEIEQQMITFEAYIHAQLAKDVPLFLWLKYPSYNFIDRAICRLDVALTKIRLVSLPEAERHMYHKIATQVSTAVSKVVAYAMHIMGQKAEKCITEIESSDLHDEDKEHARVSVLDELEKFVRHGSRATSRIYVALDLLREYLVSEESHKANQTEEEKMPVSVNHGREMKDLLSTSRKATAPVCKAWSSVAFTLAVITCLAVVPIMVLMSGCHVMGTITRAGAHVGESLSRNHTNSFEHHNLEQRFRTLELTCEANTERLNNLVDSLGSTNTEGLYYLTTSRAEEHPPLVKEKDCRAEIKAAADNLRREADRMQKEMQQMRKNFNRMDLRLTKRLEKLDRGV